MKVLTVCQPWAWAIIHGDKRIENRQWATSYRGELAIHAGKSRTWLDDACGLELPSGLVIPPPSELVFGAIIGIVELVDCRPLDSLRLSDAADRFHASGPFCWVLRRPRPCKPYPCSGSLGLWEVPRGLIPSDPSGKQ